MPGQPLVIAYHLIWTVYGWWLPNDPRGSGSRLVRNDVLRSLGELHHGRKAVQPAGSALRAFYQKAADELQYPLLTLGPAEIPVVVQAFTDALAAQRYTCWACAIMHDHVHVLIRKHKHTAEEMIENLKALSRKRLGAQRAPRAGAWTDQGVRQRLQAPNLWSGHPVWAGGGGWKVFLDHPDDIRRTIAYINSNPSQLSLLRQHWPFITAYNGWPLHPGHSPRSPYVRALRAVGRYP